MDCSTPGLLVPHHLLECAQVHVHRVSDAIQPSHPLLSPSPAFNIFQHQCLFQWVSSSHQVAKVLELHLASVLPMNIQGWFPLGLTGLISLMSKGLSRVFSSITVWNHQFLSIQPSVWSKTHVHWVGDAIQPFHPLLSPSPPALSLSQHQVLFQWVNSLHQAAKVLELQLQHQSFQWIFRVDFL